MGKRGGREAIKGLGLRKLFCIPENMVVPEGSSPESGLSWLLRSHWGQVASCSLLLSRNLTKRRVVIGRIDG